MDRFGLWPWVWRSSPGAASFTATLLTRQAWIALVLVFLTLGVVNPILEEVIFRYGVLRWFSALGHSKTVGVLASSALFSAVHFGPRFRFSPADAVPGVALFLFGVLLGVVTLRGKGRITVAASIHCGRNLVEQAALVLALIS